MARLLSARGRTLSSRRSLQSKVIAFAADLGMRSRIVVLAAVKTFRKQRRDVLFRELVLASFNRCEETRISHEPIQNVHRPGRGLRGSSRGAGAVL